MVPDHSDRARVEQPLLFASPEPEQEPQGPVYDLYCQVALNRPVRCEFTYGVPRHLEDLVLPGMRVAVPFGRQQKLGVVVRTKTESEVDPKKLKEIVHVLDPEPVVDVELLGLTRWIAERYGCAWGEALAAVLPAPLKSARRRRRVAYIEAVRGSGDEALAKLEALGDRGEKQHRLLRTLLELSGRIELKSILRQLQLSDSPAKTLCKRGWVSIEYVEELPDVLAMSVDRKPRPKSLSQAQEEAIRTLTQRLDKGEDGTFLLHGVTGSGKTEVYLRAIEHALCMGKSAIVLVPEIALTPQTVGRFRARFGEVCVLHSAMSDVQRLAEWMRLKRGDVRVVVGARSAIFAPLSELGVIVIDEEHEPSFKQESTPRYQARDVAVERAKRAGAICILGSATPALESYHQVKCGKYERLSLPERVGGGSIPNIQVIDTRLEKDSKSPVVLFTRQLKTLLRETLDNKEQAILFLNRRGFVPVLYCQGCQTTIRCEQCSLAMTLHRRIGRLVCHACCQERPISNTCPTCSKPGLSHLGLGTERIESQFRILFPEARVCRMDSDTMRRREDYERVLGAYERRELDVLIGTQMIAKGLDFPNVTLVGILSADQTLNIPDFRSSERTFQLISQVAGRAGRSHLPGRILVQTTTTHQPAIQYAVAHDYEGFVQQELGKRKTACYPPYTRMTRVLVEGEDEGRVKKTIRDVHARLLESFKDPSVGIGDPVHAPTALLRGRHRHNFYCRSALDEASHLHLVGFLADLAQKQKDPLMKIDVDPVSTS
ncbi:MAG: primosomal protein N' [Planctomycetes bacterium]|nr:primosomal protein N' [Planctomycetota bacterium]